MAGKVAIQGWMDFVQAIHGDTPYAGNAAVAAVVATAVTAGIEIVAWEMTVPAQQFIQWGHGDPRLPLNQGYMWLSFMEDGVKFENGLVLLCAQNNARTKIAPVKRMSDSQLHSVDNTDITTAALLSKQEMTPLPMMGPKVIQDSRLQIRYTPTATCAGCDDADFSIPITRFAL